MKIGYVRAPEGDRSLREQWYKLMDNECEEDNIFIDKFTNKSTDNQHQLELALKKINSGDVLVVTKLDRVAKSLPSLNQLLKKLQSKKAGLMVINQKFGTPITDAELLVDVVNSINQFDNALIREQNKSISKKTYQSEHDPFLQDEAEKYVLTFKPRGLTIPDKRKIALDLFHKDPNKFRSNKSSGFLSISTIMRRFNETW